MITNSWHAQNARRFANHTPIEVRGKQMLAYIVQYQAENGGVTPAFSDMKLACRIASTSGVKRVLDWLESEGKIRRLPNRARAIEIVPQAVPVMSTDGAQFFKVERIDDQAVLVPMETKNAR